MIGAMLAKRATREAFAAMNRKDLGAFMGYLAEDGVFEFPGHSRISGRFQGKADIQAWFRRYWDGMPSLEFTLRHVAVEQILAFSATNATAGEWDLVETDRVGRTYRLTGVTAIEQRGGKVVHVRDYVFDPLVVEEAWGPAEQPSESTAGT